MKKKLLGSLLMLQASLALGQTKPASTDNWQTLFFESPSTALPILTAAAIKHSAQIKSLDIQKSMNELDIKLAKKGILSGIGAIGTYTYGNQGSIGAYVPTGGNGVNTTTSGRYSVGASMALPLLSVIGRSSTIKKEEMNYQRADLARVEMENQMRQQVIQSYQNVLLTKKLFALQQETYVTEQTSFRLAEKQFRQGQLSLTEFSGLNTQLNSVSIAQETARSQYETAFMLLEELVGAKISSLMITR
jgi:outer membrane protein TolC